MNKEIKEKWLTSLRSGEYQQGRTKLRDINNNYCCLGVLCDLYRKETNNGEWDSKAINGDYHFKIKNTHRCSAITLTEQVFEWAELPSSNPELMLINEKTNLILLNDELKYDFNQIADLIEQNF